VVLALAEQPTAWRYGYQLCQQLGLKPGSLYPILVRLADRALLETTWDTDVPAGRPPRHLYRLTGSGRALWSFRFMRDGRGREMGLGVVDLDGTRGGVTLAHSIAHKGALVGAKVMAASVLDLLTSAELLAAAKKQFEQDTKDTKYFSLLPPGAKPPLDLNKDIMDRYRPAMRKFYLNKKAQFK
jgi:hypothetical protein